MLIAGAICALAVAGFLRAGIDNHSAPRATAASATELAYAASQALEGRASVIDGDTIEIHGERVRFNGIDAPESWQQCEDAQGVPYRCGKAAAEALDAFLAASRPTRCEYVERDRYGRFVGDCYRADGKSVAVWLVRNGHALDWPQYSEGAYAADQDDAKRRRVGMWRGDFVPPWEARRLR